MVLRNQSVSRRSFILEYVLQYTGNLICTIFVMAGDIERRQAGLLVGSCQGFASFHGEIDDVSRFAHAY